MGIKDIVRSLFIETVGVSAAGLSEKAEERRIQDKQGGHHLPPAPGDGPPLDDTDRNTDKVIEPVKQDNRLGERRT